MPIRLIPIMCFMALLFFACEQPNANKGDTSSAAMADKSNKPSAQFSAQGKTLEDVEAGPGEVKKSSSGRDFTHKRGSALSILNHRISEDPDDFYSIIEDGIWQYQFIFDGKMTRPDGLDKVYIDFKDDLTYEKGKSGKVTETGKYHYSFKTDQVLMIPDDSTKNPQEWNAMFKSNIFMILVGTPEYGNNNFQMKLERRKSKDEL